jgi:hypothetical protein
MHWIRNAYEVVPDAPIGRFALEGGKKYSLLENSDPRLRILGNDFDHFGPHSRSVPEPGSVARPFPG